VSLIFVDTGGWIGLLNRNDDTHEISRVYYQARIEEGARFLTTNYVVDETATRLRYDVGLPAALAFRDALRRAIAEQRLRLRWIDPRLEREAWALLEKHPKLELSLTDAASAVVARRAKSKEIFGFDSDFRALGFDLRPAQ